MAAIGLACATTATPASAKCLFGCSSALKTATAAKMGPSYMASDIEYIGKPHFGAVISWSFKLPNGKAFHCEGDEAHVDAGNFNCRPEDTTANKK